MERRFLPGKRHFVPNGWVYMNSYNMSVAVEKSHLKAGMCSFSLNMEIFILERTWNETLMGFGH